MRIATWNVNSVRTRLDQVRAWIESEEPDVLCLQETKVPDDLFPASAFESLGYRTVTSGQKAYNGVAILSRSPIEDVGIGFSSLFPADPDIEVLDDQRRVIAGLIDGIRVLNVYVPNGSSLQSDKYAYKLAWLDALRRYVGELEKAGDPLCLVGDFNIALEDRDLHDPMRLSGGIMASEAERRGLRAALSDRLQDAFRVFEADTGHWSWWDYRSGAWDRDRGWRIDHIYLTQDLIDRATGCRIHKRVRANDQPSDHVPVVVNLAWPPDDESSADDW